MTAAPTTRDAPRRAASHSLRDGLTRAQAPTPQPARTLAQASTPPLVRALALALTLTSALALTSAPAATRAAPAPDGPPRPERPERPATPGTAEAAPAETATPPAATSSTPAPAAPPVAGAPAAATATEAEPTQLRVTTRNEGDDGAFEAAIAKVPGLAETEARCVGKPIASAELLDCLGTRCQNRDERAKLLSLTDLTPGRVLASGALARGMIRLVETGFFRIAALRCVAGPTGARVAITVRGNRLIRSIRFVGNHDVTATELRGKLIFQPGDVLNPGTDEGRDLIARQVTAYEALYQREGFERVAVEIVGNAVDVDKVAVEVRIDEGLRQRIGAVRTRVLDPHVPSKREREAQLECPRVSVRTIVRASELSQADVFTRRVGVKARARVRDTLRRVGYHNPKVSVELDQRDQSVTIEIRLGRCSAVRILQRESSELAGREAPYNAVELDDLKASLPFAESGVFDLSEAERGRRELAALFENRGYLFAEVELDFREVPRAWGSRVASAITYRVTTGYPAQIRGLRFCDGAILSDAEGREEPQACAGRAAEALFFEPGELLGAIVTRPYDVLDQGGFLATAQMFGDLERVRQFYRDAGFFEFRFSLHAPAAASRTRVLRERVNTKDEEIIRYLLGDRGFRVRRPLGENFIYVEVPVEEGRRARFVSVELAGVSAANHDRVSGLLNLERGAVASHAIVTAAVRRIEDDYHSLGYFQASVEVSCSTRNRAVSVQLGAASGMAPCTAQRILAEEVALRIEVTEGPRVRIGEIFVRGNFRTDASLITRDMPAYGSDFSANRLFDSLRALRNLGIFRSVSFRYIGRDEVPVRDHIAIVITVVEESRAYAELSTGFQTVNVQRTDSVGELGRTPSTILNAIEHVTSAGGRLGSTVGQRLGVSVPNLLLMAEGNLVFRNLLDQGEEVRFVLRGGVTPRVFEADAGGGTTSLASEPALIVAAAVYNNQRFLGSDVGLRIIAPYFSRDFATTTIDLEKVGAAAEISKRFGKLGLWLGADGGPVRFLDASLNQFVDWSLQFKAIPRLTYDGLDSPINPTRGVYASASAAYINAVIENLITRRDANGDVVVDDAGNPRLVSVPLRGNFLRLEAQGKGYVTFRDTLTLGAMVRVGSGVDISSAGKAQLPENERFRLGGQLGLRGYTDNGVLRYDANGAPIAALDDKGQRVCDPNYTAADGTCTGYNAENDGDVIVNGSVEARFPILRDRGFWGAVFWDFGGIADTWSNLHSASIRHGIGFGLRFLVSGQIPIRIDYGIAINRRCQTATDALSATGCPALEDFGNLQAGLLYAF
jgi:outer membrane protein assembly factor BamA